VAKFLTAEWLDALTKTVNTHEGFTSSISAVELTLQFEIPDAPEGTEGAYYMAVSGGKAIAAPGTAEDADATIVQSYETAEAISKGELNTQMAFMTGKLKVSGNMAKLMMNQAMLGQFAAATAGLDVEY
jgi:putative sterol carrier protein